MSTAIESLTSVSVRSDFFKNNVTFEFFPTTHKNRVALTYGKNGSGKSTIAQGLWI